MNTTQLTIETRGYLLSPDVDVPALQIEICDAMRRGSGIVAFDVLSGQRLTTVISPGVAVVFEEVGVSRAEESHPSDDDLAAITSYLDGY